MRNISRLVFVAIYGVIAIKVISLGIQVVS